MHDFHSLIPLSFIGCMRVGCMRVDLVYPFTLGPFCAPSCSEEIRLHCRQCYSCWFALENTGQKDKLKVHTLQKLNTQLCPNLSVAIISHNLYQLRSVAVISHTAKKLRVRCRSV